MLNVTEQTKDDHDSADDGPGLNEHCAVNSRFESGDLGTQFSDTGLESLWRDVLGRLADGVRKRGGLTALDARLGQPAGDGE